MSLMTEFGEFTLDYFIQDDLIKELPIVGPAFSMVKIGVNIRDRIFVEKLKSFIENIDKNQKWREKFSNIEECNKISKQLYVRNLVCIPLSIRLDDGLLHASATDVR